jgi:shikimate dehydrogenase
MPMRDEIAAMALVDELRQAGRIAGTINVTPSGMKDRDPLPFYPAALPALTLVVDVVTKPEMTLPLERAASTGHRIRSGRHMHYGQAIDVAWFFGFTLES